MLVEGPIRRLVDETIKGYTVDTAIWFQERIYKANGVSIEFTKVETVRGSSSYPCSTFEKS